MKLGLVLAFALACGAPVFAEVALTATLADVKGEVAIRQDAGAWQAVENGRMLTQADEVFTGVESEATVNFSDGSSMTIRELTQILIGTILQKENRKDVAIRLKVGELKAQVKKEKVLDTNFEIQTPTATASVRGTEINEVSFHPARGMTTDLKTGALLVRSARGATMTRPSDRARVDPRGNLRAPADFKRQGAQARVEPVGLTRRERAQIGKSQQPRSFTPRGNPDPGRPEGNGPIIGRAPPVQQFGSGTPVFRR